MSNGQSIKISPKYGVNPTIPVCFFCGEPKNEVALLGRIGKGTEDIEAPRHALLNYEPCEECLKKMATGITLVEVSNTPNSDNQPPIVAYAYPTGNWWVVDEDFVRNNIQPPELAEQVIVHRKCLVDADAITFRKKVREREHDKEMPGA